MKAIDFNDVTTANECRTVCIEAAVEELSRRDNPPEMIDVRQCLNELLRKKIPTGKIKTYTDPNGDEVEYEEKIPASKVYHYSSLDEKEVLSRAVSGYWNNYTFKHDIPKNLKVSDWLKNLRDSAFFIPASEIYDFVEWDRQFVEDIQYTCEYGQPRNDRVNGLHMKLDSSVKGVGKSFFIRGLVEGAKKLGLEACDEVSMPEGGFYNTVEESRNLIVGYNEADKNVDEKTLKNIGRRELYDYTVKGLPRVQLRARAVTLGSTNGYDYCKEDRAFKTFHCLPARFTDFPEYIQKNAIDLTPYNIKNYMLKKSNFWISGFLDYIDSKKKKDLLSNELNSRSRNTEDSIDARILSFLKTKSSSRFLIDVITSLNGDLDLLNSISVAKLSKLYKKYNGVELTYPQKLLLSELLNGLYSKGLINKTGYETNDLYVRYDIFKLKGIRHEDLFEDIELTIQDEIQLAQDTWNELIEAAIKWESENPDDDPSEGEKDMTIEDEVGDAPIVEEEPEIQEVEEGQLIGNVEDLFKENDIFEYKEDDMVEGVLKTNYIVISGCIKTKKGLKAMVLKFKDKKTGKSHAKYYFIYDKEDPSQILDNGATNQFIEDVKQIWFSRGRDLDDDVEWAKFTERMLLVMKSKQKLCISAYLKLKNNYKNPYFVDAVYLPEDYEINKEVRK